MWTLIEERLTARLRGDPAVRNKVRQAESAVAAGTLTPKNAQIFANVLIGRAKPWIAQIPLNDLKPAEADLLVHCALVSAFSVPHAPVTQLGVIKWAAEAGRLNSTSARAAASCSRAASSCFARAASSAGSDRNVGAGAS